MPILWRYLLSYYFKVLLIALVSFIAVLVVSRFEEIAHLASLGAPSQLLIRFVLYQIPYILPVALPISALLSSILLLQKLSNGHELTAFRSAGLSLKSILAPLLTASLLLSCFNFYVTSEVATAAHLAARKMVHELTSINPLLLFQSAQLSQLREGYCHMHLTHQGRAAEDFMVALYNSAHKRLDLLTALSLKMEEEECVYKDLTLISSPSTQEGADQLLIENQTSGTLPSKSFATLLRKKGWKLANDHLDFKLLKAKMELLKNDASQPHRFKELAKCRADLVRRLSMGMAPLSFTLLGCSFGAAIGRLRSRRKLLIVLFYAGLTLVSFFMAKELHHHFWIAALLFLLPHLWIFSHSSYALYRISLGAE